MNAQPKHVRLLLAPVAALFCLVLFLSGGWQPAPSAQQLSSSSARPTPTPAELSSPSYKPKVDKPPFTLSNILKVLNTEKTVDTEGNEVTLTPAERNDLILRNLSRGVAFLFTPEVETSLKDAGASAALINGIRREAAKLRGDEIKIHNIAVRYKDLGDAAKVQLKFDEALDNYNQALELNDQLTFAYIGRGLTYREMAIKFHKEKNYAEENNHLDKAIAEFTRVTEIDPTHIGAWYNRAMCHYEKFTNNNQVESRANAEKALADLDRVLQLNAKYRDAYQGRAWVYRYLLGDKEKAVEAYQKCQELNGCKSDDVQRYISG